MSCARRASVMLTAAALAATATACSGSGDESLRACANGIVVYADVACEAVTFDADRMDPETQDRIDELRAEAEAEPERAVAIAQTIQRLVAAQPFQVCEALQNNPEDDFVNSETIAPIAVRYAETICPGPETIALLAEG